MHETDHGDGQLAAHGCELILESWRALMVRHAFQHSGLDQPLEPIGEYVASHAEAALEVVEASQPEQCVTHNKQSPTFAEHLKGTGYRTRLVIVGPAEHLNTISSFSCVTLLSYKEIGDPLRFVDLDVVAGVVQ
jgi:hypothetical protein